MASHGINRAQSTMDIFIFSNFFQLIVSQHEMPILFLSAALNKFLIIMGTSLVNSLLLFRRQFFFHVLHRIRYDLVMQHPAGATTMLPSHFFAANASATVADSDMVDRIIFLDYDKNSLIF